jgi:hypothetical protein
MNLFFQDYITDEGIASNDPIVADLDTAIDIFYELNDEEDNFFGLIDDSEKCIQFMFISEDKWLVDIPIPPDFNNLQKYATYEECVSIIKETFLENKIIRFLDKPLIEEK